MASLCVPTWMQHRLLSYKHSHVQSNREIMTLWITRNLLTCIPDVPGSSNRPGVQLICFIRSTKTQTMSTVSKYAQKIHSDFVDHARAIVMYARCAMFSKSSCASNGFFY